MKPVTINWETVTNSKEVSKNMLEWRVQHFGQLMDTTLVTGEWKQRLEPMMESNILQKFEEGDDEPPDGSLEEVIEFLNFPSP